MKCKAGWNNSVNGNNSSGFNGLPGGYCYYSGYFSDITVFGYWWRSSEYSTNYAWNRDLDFSNTRVGRNYGDKYNGFSVRCLRD